MPIQLLAFDLDDTLWPCLPTILHAEETLYAWLQVNVPEITTVQTMEALRDQRSAFLQANPHLHANLTEARKAFLHTLSTQHNIHHDWVDSAFEVFHRARQQVTLFDDVSDTLDQLQGRYRMAAISNGNADIQQTGVGHWFEFQVTAEQAGAAKPHPAIFNALLSRAGLDAEAVVTIGDDPHRDIYGASQLGMKTVWVNRQQQNWQHPHCEPDTEVTDFGNLHNALEQLEATL